jgi:uncharacterized protein YggT (Ycf19 family)
VAVFITALSYLILARILLQLFVSDESRAFQFCYAVTEPVLSPVRDALSRFDALADSPVDFSAFVTIILLTLVKIFLPPLSNFL